jgi:hypothetical protein
VDLTNPDFDPYGWLFDQLGGHLNLESFNAAVAWVLAPAQRTNVTLVVLAIAAFLVSRWGMHRQSTAKPKGRDPLHRGAPGRVPFLDRPKRWLFVGYGQGRNFLGRRRAVKVALDISHFLCAGGTRSGKSAVLAQLVDGSMSTLALCFDIALPVVAATRRLQQRIMDGKAPRVPVYVWRPAPQADDPTAVTLRLLEGQAEEVMSNLQDAFKVAGTGHYKSIVWRIGAGLLQECDRVARVRSLERLAIGLEAIAKDRQALDELARRHTIVAGVEWDRNTREAAFSWASKFRGLKAMLGEAEGHDGVELGSVLEQGGTFVVELNTFSVSEVARALGPLFLGLGAYSIDKSRRPVNLLLDEGNQLGDRTEQLDKVFTASGARGGRVGLAVQKPLKYVKELATNIDVWCLFGFGSGAIDELTWASKTTHGMVEPQAFKKQRRTAYARLMRRLGRLPNLMNRECYVVHEGAIEGPVTVPEPDLSSLLYYDWPQNRGVVVPTPGLFDADPEFDPDPVDPSDHGTWRVITPSSTPPEATNTGVAVQPVTPCNEALYQTLVDEGLPAWLLDDDVQLVNIYRHHEKLGDHELSTYRRNNVGRPQAPYQNKLWLPYALLKAVHDGLDLRVVRQGMADRSAQGLSADHLCREFDPTISEEDEKRCQNVEHIQWKTKGGNTAAAWLRRASRRMRVVAG